LSALCIGLVLEFDLEDVVTVDTIDAKIATITGMNRYGISSKGLSSIQEERWSLRTFKTWFIRQIMKHIAIVPERTDRPGYGGYASAVLTGGKEPAESMPDEYVHSLNPIQTIGVGSLLQHGPDPSYIEEALDQIQIEQENVLDRMKTLLEKQDTEAAGEVILDALMTMQPERRTQVLQMLEPQESAAAISRMPVDEALSTLQTISAKTEAERNLDRAHERAERELDLAIWTAEVNLRAAEASTPEASTPEETELETNVSVAEQEAEEGISMDLDAYGCVELIEVSLEGEFLSQFPMVAQEDGPVFLGEAGNLALSAKVKQGDAFLAFGEIDISDIHEVEALTTLITEAGDARPVTFLFGRPLDRSKGAEGQVTPKPTPVESWSTLFFEAKLNETVRIKEDLCIAEKNTRLAQVQAELLSDRKNKALKEENDAIDKEIAELTAQADEHLSPLVFEGGTSLSIKVKYGSAPSLLNPPPEKAKIEKMVGTLDADGDGQLSVEEVKVLFGKMLKVNPDEIPDDHEEVIAYSDLSKEDLIEKLATSVSKDQLDKYYNAMFSEEDAVEDGAAAEDVAQEP